MRKEDAVIILGTAHRLREPGKRSPDGRLSEAVYSREIVAEEAVKLESMGFRVFVDMEGLDLPKTMQARNVELERQRELALRVNYVNSICLEYGKDRCLYVSHHVNGSPPNDGLWHHACGWQAVVGTKAGEGSRRLAGCLFAAAEGHGLKLRRPEPSKVYWEQDLYVLNRTLCPAVLTENLFQDNLGDVGFLLSDEGRHIVERLHVEGIVRYVEGL